MRQIFAVRNNVTGEPILVKVGVIGYFPTSEGMYQQLRDSQTDKQTEAALVGSMFGWDCPGARAALDENYH